MEIRNKLNIIKIKILFSLLIIFFITGCNNINPMASEVTRNYSSFEEMCSEKNNLQSVRDWALNYITYTTAEHQYMSYMGIDETEQRVNFLFDQKKGSCGDFASLFVMVARRQNKECGFIFESYDSFAHLRGWIKNDDGTITETSNKNVYFSKYKNKEAMFDYYKSKTNGYFCFYKDNHQTIIKEINRGVVK